MINTYCYGKLKQFKTIAAAKEFYFNGMMWCEGAERDRYTDIYQKLCTGDAPYCDCDGIREKPQRRKLTDAEKRRRADLKALHDQQSDECDKLSAELERRENEFKAANKDLIDKIDALLDTMRDECYEIIKLNRIDIEMD